MQTLVLGRAREKYDGLRGSAAAFVRQLVAAAAALHSHSLEAGNAQLSQWFSVAFLSITRLSICIVFSKVLRGTRFFTHVLCGIGSDHERGGCVCCVWVPLCACEEKPRWYSFHEIKPFLRFNLKPAPLHFAAAALAASCGVRCSQKQIVS